MVLVTAPDLEVARRLARALVEEGLVACANLVPEVASIYRWEGAIEESAECLAVLKTVADRLPALEERLRALHPYDVPELVVLTAEGGAEDYLGWVLDSTRTG